MEKEMIDDTTFSGLPFKVGDRFFSYDKGEYWLHEIIELSKSETAVLTSIPAAELNLCKSPSFIERWPNYDFVNPILLH